MSSVAREISRLLAIAIRRRVSSEELWLQVWNHLHEEYVMRSGAQHSEFEELFMILVYLFIALGPCERKESNVVDQAVCGMLSLFERISQTPFPLSGILAEDHRNGALYMHSSLTEQAYRDLISYVICPGLLGPKPDTKGFKPPSSDRFTGKFPELESILSAASEAKRDELDRSGYNLLPYFQHDQTRSFALRFLSVSLSVLPVRVYDTLLDYIEEKEYIAERHDYCNGEKEAFKMPKRLVLLPSYAGLVGIHNPGSVCYITSVLQLLFAMPSFRIGLLNSDCIDLSKDSAFLGELKRIFARLLYSSRAVTNISELCAQLHSPSGEPIHTYTTGNR